MNLNDGDKLVSVAKVARENVGGRDERTARSNAAEAQSADSRREFVRLSICLLCDLCAHLR